MKKIGIITFTVLLIVLGSVVHADLTGTEGLAIDLSSAGAGTDFTIAFDPTELFGNRTWGDASTDTIVWTFNRATGTDPTITFNSGSIGLQALSLTDSITLSDAATIDQSANNYIDFLENSDKFQFYFGGTDLGLIWSDGAFNIRNAEDGIDAIVEIEGKDAGEKGVLRVMSDGDDKYIELYNDDTDAVLTNSAGNIIINPVGLGVVIGDNGNEDYTLTFDGDTSNGVLNYDEDNADFEFDQDVSTGGTFTATTSVITPLLDAAGAEDMDYGSVDVTDHTFVTDGTGDGEIVLPNDSIGDAELNWAGFTDLAAGGVLTGDCVDESHIDDDGIDSEHYNNGSIDLVHLAAGVYAKDLVTTAPITGAADNIFVGADSDVTVAITLLKDVVATSPVLIDGGTNVDDILPGADADLTISVTVAKDIVTTAPLTGAVDNVIIGTDADITLGIDVLKDLVTTAPVTGGTNDIFPGADADITVALDFTAAWDFGGAASLEIPNGTDPDVAVAGQLHLDTDGGNEPNDVSLRTFEGADTQYVIARTLKTLSFTLIEPDQIDAADLIPVWQNTSGYTFTIIEWKAWSDDDDVSLEIEELTDQTDYTAITTVDAVEIATNGTGVFYASDTTITHAAIEHDHSIAIDFDATDTPDYVQISITGWFNADVN